MIHGAVASACGLKLRTTTPQAKAFLNGHARLTAFCIDRPVSRIRRAVAGSLGCRRPSQRLSCLYCVVHLGAKHYGTQGFHTTSAARHRCMRRWITSANQQKPRTFRKWRNNNQRWNNKMHKSGSERTRRPSAAFVSRASERRLEGRAHKGGNALNAESLLLALREFADVAAAAAHFFAPKLRRAAYKRCVRWEPHTWGPACRLMICHA